MATKVEAAKMLVYKAARKKDEYKTNPKISYSVEAAMAKLFASEAAMKITKVEIITRASKLEELKQALNDIGVLGMTVSQVFGCGLSKGHTEVYRGKEYDINLVPKIKLETVVCEIPVERVLEVAQKAVRTGNIGDGKIFVYELTDAVRIRTGDRGPEAIMDTK